MCSLCPLHAIQVWPVWHTSVIVHDIPIHYPREIHSLSLDCIVCKTFCILDVLCNTSTNILTVIVVNMQKTTVNLRVEHDLKVHRYI